jgi:hypothetical protein
MSTTRLNSVKLPKITSVSMVSMRVTRGILTRSKLPPLIKRQIEGRRLALKDRYEIGE